MFSKTLKQDKIIEILEQRLKSDYNYETGKILGSMCTVPNSFATKIFNKYAYKNLGDPGLFPETYAIEQELISGIGKLLGGEHITGSIVSGGSEANLIAINIARMLNRDIKEPEIVCSENVHMSIFKASDLMGIKVRCAKLNEYFLPDMQHYEALINENTIGCIGIAGTTALGLVEPIEKIAKIADSNNLFFHVDGAFGSFVLPFLEELGHKFPLYDFRVKKVDTITADPHKMGMGVIPSGGILIRENTIVDKIGFSIPYLAGGGFKHLTTAGTRSGASALAFWAMVKSFGRSGFRNIVKRCWENAKFLAEGIKQIDGIDLAADPLINVVGIKLSDDNPYEISQLGDELRNLGWALGIFKDFNLARIVCMPHIKREHLESFLTDLEVIMNKLNKNQN